MALTTTRTYLSSDPSAPTVSGAPGAFIAVVKACLIGSGGIAYGSKPAVGGWSIVLDDPSTHRLVLRNSLAHGGLGCCVLLVNSTETVSQSCGADWDSDAEALVDPCETLTYQVSNASDATARQWAIFADERTVYFATKPNTGNLNNGGLRGAGDVESYWPGDVYAYFNLVSSDIRDTARRASAGTAGATASNGSFQVAGVDSTYAPTLSHILTCFGASVPSSELSGGYSLSTSFPATNPPNGVIFTSPAYYRVGARNEVSGRLRLLHACDHVRDTGGLVEIIAGMESTAGVPLAQVRSHTASNNNLYTPLFVEIENG